MDFGVFITAIGNSKSKQEEDDIVSREIRNMKRYLAEPGRPSQKRKDKEFLVQLIYVEMLGVDASFGYIKAVEMTASQNIGHKKTAYLCCSLCLSPDHEFRVMLVNQIKRDLSSSNHLETCAALMALCKLVTLEMVPAVIDQVLKALSHELVAVRKKAVMVLHRLHQINPELIQYHHAACRQSLFDKDPSVMASSLCLLHSLIRQNGQEFWDLVPSFVSILRQIVDHRLPLDYDYHRIPAPWVQMKLLQILALLGQANRTTSEGMYDILREVMRRADSGINIGYAVVYECVRTVVTIYPNTSLLDLAAEKISCFLKSKSNNMKYMGVTGLASIVKEYPQYAADHQLAVIDCLEDPDETLKRKTLGLLYSITNSVNVEYITDKLLSFLEGSTDTFWRNELVWRITQSAEAFAPSNSWYVKVIIQVFKEAGDLIKPDVAANLLALIAEGSSDEDAEAEEQLRRDAANMCAELLDCSASLPDSLVQIMAWVLGEYSYLITVEENDEVGHLRQEEIAEQLCTMVRERTFIDLATRGCIVTALLKLSAQSGTVPAIVADTIEHFSRSHDADLQQRCLEFQALVQRGAIMGLCLPMDASCEDLQLDEPLSFLSEVSRQAIEKGAPLYCAPLDLDGDTLLPHSEGTSSLKFAHYSAPESSSSIAPTALDAPIPDLAETIQLPADSVRNDSPGGAVDKIPHNKPIDILKLKAKGSTKVWGAVSAVEADWKKTKAYTSSASAPPPPPTSLPAVADFTATPTIGNQPSAETSTAEMKPKQKTPEELKKERMAAALFGGIGNNQKIGGGVSRRQNRWGRRVGDSSKMPSAASGESGRSTVTEDLLDMSFDMPGGDMKDRGINMNDKSEAFSNSSSSSPLRDTVQPITRSVFLESNLFEGMAVKSAAVEEFSTSSEPIRMSPCADHTRHDTSSPNLLNVENTLSYDSVPVAEAREYITPKGSDLGRNKDLSAILSQDLMGSTTATTLPGRVGGTEGWYMTSSTTTFSLGGHNMKPLVIDTDEFGENWIGSNMTERTLIGLKCGGQLTLKTPEDVMQVLALHGLHPVESIPSTSEGICAGTCNGTRVLVHFKLHPQSATIDVTACCQNANIIDAFVLFLKCRIEISSAENDSK